MNGLLERLLASARAANLTILGFLVVVVVAFSLACPPGTFLSAGNVRSMALAASTVLVLGVGMTFLLIAGGLDLSVGAISALITKTPELKAIFASWTNAVIGTGQAVEQSGKKIDVIGVDAAPDEVSLLKRGVVTALMAQKPAEMGQIAVDDLVGYVKDGTKPPAEKLMDAVAITSDQATGPAYTKYFYVTAPKK